MMKRWVSLACLLLVLLGVPVTMGACADLGSLVPPSPTFKANGSPQYPYPVAVTLEKGSCTAWSIVYDNGMGDPLCARTLPTHQIGMYVLLSYKGTPAGTVCLVSIDARRQIARVL